MSRTIALAYVLPALMAAAALVFPIALPAGYHDFADHSAIGSLHPFGDLVSNLAFVAAGIFVLARSRTAQELWLALSLCLAGIGSWYYHLHPTDLRLLVDRVPIAFACAAMASIVLFDHDPRKGLIHTAASSGLYTAAAAYATWSGNHAVWVAAQVYVLLLLVSAALARPPMRAAALAAFALYGGAKLCEGMDHEILHLTGFVSGHTLKHLLAALAPVMWFALWRRGTKGESWFAQCHRPLERAPQG